MLFPKLAEPEAAGKTEGETSEGEKPDSPFRSPGVIAIPLKEMPSLLP